VDIGIVCLAAQLGSVCSQVFVNNSAILEFQHLLRPDLCVVSTADKLEWFLSLSLSVCVCAFSHVKSLVMCVGLGMHMCVCVNETSRVKIVSLSRRECAWMPLWQ